MKQKKSRAGFSQKPQKAKPNKNKQKQMNKPVEKSGKRKHRPTKFEEYLEMEKKKTGFVTAEDDCELERRLGKKLKVKDGLLRDLDDGLSDLLEGLQPASLLDSRHSKIKTVSKSGKKSQSDDDDEEEEEDGVSDASDEDEVSNLSQDEDGVSESSDEDDEAEIQDDGHSDEEEDDGNSDEQQDNSNSDDEELDEQPASDSEEADAQLHGQDSEDEEPANETNKHKDNGNDGKLTVKYVAPHLRASNSHSNELIQIQRRCRGLLNRLSEENVESIAQEIITLFQVHGRRVMTETVTDEIITAVSSGPRGNAQYAAVFAAFVAGITASVGMDFGAKFLAALASSFQENFKKEDNLAVRNISLLLSYVYIFKLTSCDLIYDLIGSLSKTLMELDVATILTILETCGMGLRGDDPVAMKDFVVSVQHRCEELKANATQSGTIFITGKRMEFMLETICEIKNNKKKVKQESIPHQRLKKWLQKLGIEEVQLRSLTWNKLLDPDKKGQWWIKVEGELKESNCAEVVGLLEKETVEAEKMLKLAASQRMNTDIRRAIFCVVMSAEDYLDAFEKILRIKLSGKQDREIMRVIVECCLQEKVFNKYYSLLIRKLCHHEKNHKFTIQYCLWDHFKQLSSMETRRIMNLAHLVADLIGNFVLSLSVLKVVEFTDVKIMTPKAILHFRLLFKLLLTGYNDQTVASIFSRIAAAQELEGLRAKLTVFLHQNIMKGLEKQEAFSESEKLLLKKRFVLAKKVMANSITL